MSPDLRASVWDGSSREDIIPPANVMCAIALQAHGAPEDESPFSAPSVSAISASSVSCTAAWISGLRNSLSDAKSCLTADTSVLIFVTVMVVLAPLRAVIFETTGLTMTASVAQLLQNLPHSTETLGFGGSDPTRVGGEDPTLRPAG